MKQALGSLGRSVFSLDAKAGRCRYRLMSAVLLLVSTLLPLCGAMAAQYPLTQPNGFTWGELAVLPEYCKDTQGTVWDKRGNGGPESPNLPHWLGLMGDDFFHLHHYCYGLRDFKNAELAGEGSPRGQRLLLEGLNQLSYVIRNCQPNMILMPEVFLKQGDALLKLGRVIEAKESYERSRSLKPDYWPAYAKWADVLMGLKQFDTARQLLKEGLSFSPDQPELTQRLTSLERPRQQSRAEKKPAARPPASAASR
jgi:tetratricopeptide (TPR) repeat protein